MLLLLLRDTLLAVLRDRLLTALRVRTLLALEDLRPRPPFDLRPLLLRTLRAIVGECSRLRLEGSMRACDWLSGGIQLHRQAELWSEFLEGSSGRGLGSDGLGGGGLGSVGLGS